MHNVLLVDIAMPDEHGLTLMRKVRSLSPERGGRIPAATLTAAPPGEGQLALWTAAGFQRHILKPFLPPALIATVNELAGREVERRRCALDRRQWPGAVSRDRRAERRGSLCLSVA